MAVQYALTLHFGWMCGQHRRDERVLEKAGELTIRDSGLGRTREGELDAALLRGRAGDVMRATLAVAMQIFGYVRKLGEIRERSDHGHRVCRTELRQYRLQLAARLWIALAAETNRRLADALDQLESVLTLLLAQGIAQYAAEQADVVF